MDSGKVNDWLQVGGIFGLLAGLIFVGLQLMQDRQAVMAQTRSELSMGIVQLLSDVYSDAEFSDIMMRGDFDPESLRPEELFRYQVRSRALFRYWENVHYQYREGLYEEGEFRAQKGAWKAYLDTAGAVRGAWCIQRSEFATEFAAEVDGLIDLSEC